MSTQTLIRNPEGTSYVAQIVTASVSIKCAPGSPQSSAGYDLIAFLRDHYVFDDFVIVERWIRMNPQYIGLLFEASYVADAIFGAGRSKWLSVCQDWEGSETIQVEIEFGGSPEEASRLCRQVVESWQIGLETNFRQIIELSVRFA